jgi:hypothetical protein
VKVLHINCWINGFLADFADAWQALWRLLEALNVIAMVEKALRQTKSGVVLL